MTVGDILTNVRFLGQYNTLDGDNPQLIALLNDIVADEIKVVASVREDYFLKEGTALDLVAGEDTYDLSSDILQLKQVQISYDGQNYQVAYRKNLNEADELNRETEAQAAPKYITVDQTEATEFKIRLQPTPQQAVTGGIRYWYIQRAPKLTDTTDTPILPPELHPVLVQRLLQMLKQRDGDLQGMAVAQQEANRVRQEWKTSISERNIDRWEGFYQSIFEE